MGDFENGTIIVALALARVKGENEYNKTFRRLITSEKIATSVRATVQQDMYEYTKDNPGEPLPLTMEEIGEDLEEYKDEHN